MRARSIAPIWLWTAGVAFGAQAVTIWQDARPDCRLVLPAEPKSAALVASTINNYLRRSFGIELPIAERLGPTGMWLVAGTPESSPALAELAHEGLKPGPDPGDDGFRLLSQQTRGRRCLVIYGRTPRALKHGCQELLFYRLAATNVSGRLDWPLDISMRPAFAYRGIYMLPCWAAHDSHESWERVLRFNSELTLNRNWFWLDGFPVAGHPGEYAGTDLADGTKVQRLLDLADAEDMKILIGGGWFTWHHEKAVGKDLQKGIDYYMAYLSAFRHFHGFYIEPTGEGTEDKNWPAESEALLRLVRTVLERRPGFEFAIAIGKFNSSEYLRRLATLDPGQVYWWWCWGDPIRDRALDMFPSVLRWHTIRRMSDFHGSCAAPEPRERPLAGVVTSYDPGQGFGNPWNGWGRLGADKPRNFDPYDIPYFGHEYLYRERCWNPDLDEPAFLARLQRRLFDADAPGYSARLYWKLTQMTLAADEKVAPRRSDLAPIRRFVGEALQGDWTPRMKDTLARMNTALTELEKRAAPEP